MTRLIVFVEEESAEAALDILIPKMVPTSIEKTIINLQNKQSFLREVPARLRGYARSFNKADLRIVLLLDRDRDDCKILKQRLEGAAHEAGLPTRSRPHPSGQVSVLTRIVVVELESWFLGDPDALTAAFPKLGSLNPAKPPLRDPDQGTWEALERLLQRGGYPGRYAKIAGARRIAANMEPARNASPSFQSFRQGLHDLLAGPSGLRAD